MSKPNLRTLLLCLCLTILAAPLAARAEQWPTGPVRIIESLPAGVARDNATRILAQKLSTILGQQVFVENRPGAAGRTAAVAAAKASPDGYTFIMMGTSEIAIIRHLYNLTYDIERDFDPVSMVATVPVALVIRPSLPIKTLAEFIAYAKSRPDELTYGSTGPGLFLHLNGALLASKAGIKLRHIPYQQGNPFADLLGGHVDMVIDALQPTYENILGGKLRGIALTGDHRAKVLPDLEVSVTVGEYTPGGTNKRHAHLDCLELIFVMQGAISTEIEGEGTRLTQAGEILCLRPDVLHQGRNASDSEPAKFVIVKLKRRGAATTVAPLPGRRAALTTF